jgi:hypothetical protein
MPTSRFAAQFMLNVSFVVASAISVVGQERKFVLAGKLTLK